MPLYRLHRSEFESTHILVNRELEFAIRDGDQTEDQALYVHGMNALSAWYAGKPAKTVHLRHQSYLENPFKGAIFVEPWWWNHPLYIEQCRAHLLSNCWFTYKDNQYLANYLRPEKVPFIKPHPTIIDQWDTPNGPLKTDWELWRALGWVARIEDPLTRRNRIKGLV